MRIPPPLTRELLLVLVRTEDEELPCAVLPERLARLLDALAGAPPLPAAERAAVREHLALCRDCRDELAALLGACERSAEDAAGALGD